MNSNLSSCSAFLKLQQQYRQMQEQGVQINHLFDQDPDRFEAMSLSAAGLFLDYSKNQINGPSLQPTNSPPLLGFVSLQVATNVSLAHPSPFEQIQTSVGQIMGTFHALFSPKSEIGVQQLGGAVMIIRVYSNLFQSDDGWRRVLWFSVVMNVNLALLNMLPLPVLDGGHILLSIIEFIRRRPVSNSILQFIQTGFAAMLIVFMLYLAFFDTGDWVRSSRADRDVPVVFAPNK